MTESMGVFDIIGPVMVGPSSSHTAGAVRLGLFARILLDEEPKKARVLLHGSFRETFRGHGTDLALISGLLGLNPDDIRIKDAFRLAKEASLEFSFDPIEIDDAHPNTVQFLLDGESGHHLEMQGASIGGGNVIVTEINGFSVSLRGKYETLFTVHKDVPGVITQVARVLSDSGINVAYMQVIREEKGELAAMVIETDHLIPREIKDYVSTMENVEYVLLIRKVQVDW